MSRRPGKLRVAALSLALSAATSTMACTPKASTPTAAPARGEVTVAASDTACEVSRTTGPTGAHTFVVDNAGSKVTEFYVYAEGDRVMGEVENIAPGARRSLVVQLGQPGTYRTACKPGMVGDGIRGDYVVTGDAAPVDQSAEYVDAAAEYKGYVTSQTDALVAATRTFTNAIERRDFAAAKNQFPIFRTHYERIEPVAESFPNDLDPRLDQREADLEAGHRWTGFHRLEKDLWVTGPQPDTDAIDAQLMADVGELDAGVKSLDWSIDATQIAGGAQTLLDEIAKTKVGGEEDVFSHTDLWDFAANVEGSRTAVASVRPILDRRSAELGTRVDQRFAEVDTILAQYRQGDGYVAYDAVTEPQRRELSRSIDALGAEVSQVQGAIAPR